MGTHSITVVYDEQDTPLVALYGQYDGYPEGHGKDLKNFLKGKKVINGIGAKDDASKCFNGMGCLAAALIGHFKTGIGNYYIVPVDEREQYNYYVKYKKGKIVISTDNGQEEI